MKDSGSATAPCMSLGPSPPASALVEPTVSRPTVIPNTDGSSGKVQVTQVGIFNNGFHGAVGDGFPAESIIVNKH